MLPLLIALVIVAITTAIVIVPGIGKLFPLLARLVQYYTIRARWLGWFRRYQLDTGHHFLLRRPIRGKRDVTVHTAMRASDGTELMETVQIPPWLERIDNADIDSDAYDPLQAKYRARYSREVNRRRQPELPIPTPPPYPDWWLMYVPPPQAQDDWGQDNYGPPFVVIFPAPARDHVIVQIEEVDYPDGEPPELEEAIPPEPPEPEEVLVPPEDELQTNVPIPDYSYARWLGRMLRSEIGNPSRNEANYQLALRMATRRMAEHGLRPSHIVQQSNMAAVAALTPTREEIEAKVLLQSLTMAEAESTIASPKFARHTSWLYNLWYGRHEVGREQGGVTP